METSDFEAIFMALEAAKARYIVVGGVAVVLHGAPRFTADLDVVLALDHANVTAALGALDRLGYRPRAPVNAIDLADPEIRKSWIADKGVVVLAFWSPEHPATEIDIFVEEPFAFDEAFARAIRADLGTTIVVVAAIEDLIALKRRVGRPKDLADISALEAIAIEDADD